MDVQDCVTSLYQSLGMSAGAKFSSEDVTLLYRRVFHAPSSSDEAHAATQKIAGGDTSWSCVGENVIDVLLEMERERQKMEKLYWDLQLLNVGNPNSLHEADKPFINNSHVLHQSTDSHTFIRSHNKPDSGSVQLCTFDTDSLQRERLVRNKDQNGSVRWLKKAARNCWARLASEGVQSILLPSLWQGQSREIRGQAWGCVMLSDVLFLVDVKYDVVTHLLYTEMLQEHYTLSTWESMLPWQQHEEEERLEDSAEEALESGDMVGLAELPGAFRMYSGSSKESRSAVSLLFDLHTFRRQERDTLIILCERLDRESLRLVCLHIRLATLRARREKTSHSALLAARQSWETWPHVRSPCRTDQAALWLQSEDQKQQRGHIPMSPHQALLRLLVLTEEQEKKHLLKVVHGISLGDLQEPESRFQNPQREDSQEQSAFRNGCLKKLRQIHAGMQTHNEKQIPQPKHHPHPQMGTHISSEICSQRQLEDCSQVLMAQLIELQEVQASAVLSALMDKSAHCIQALRHEYECELQTPCCTNTLQLLISDAALTAVSVVTHVKFTKNDSEEQPVTQSCTREVSNSSGGTAEAPNISVSRQLDGVQAEDGADTEDVCTGCGGIIEVLPYLEIVCVSDATSTTPQSPATEDSDQAEDKSCATTSQQSYEKQGSLITLAWGKLLEDNTDCEAEATGQSQDVESGLKTQIQPSERSSVGENVPFVKTSGETDKEDVKPVLVQSESSGHLQSAEQQFSTLSQLMLEERATAGPRENTEAVPECDLLECASVADTLQSEQPHLKCHLCSGMCSETVHLEREVAEVDIWPTVPEPEDLRGPNPAHGLKFNSQTKVDCCPVERESTLTEREQDREPMSAVERETTMRNLVDMQRKVEQRQQRDRERQLLKVQERLSIIQSRKAEEDLLGLKHTERLRHLTQDLPQENKNQQKTVVRERLEQLRRERSYVMQSKRDRNTAGFKELLAPVTLHGSETDDGTDRLSNSSCFQSQNTSSLHHS